MAKKITIEDLAEMVKRGFDQTASDMNAFQENVDRKFSDLELKITSYASSYNKEHAKLLGGLKDHEERITFLEKTKK